MENMLQIIGLTGGVRLLVLPDYLKIDDISDVGKGLLMRSHGLTNPEINTLDLLSSGLTIEKISGKLDVSTKTVQNRIESIYLKLKVRSRAEASAYATSHGFGTFLRKLNKA